MFNYFAGASLQLVLNYDVEWAGRPTIVRHERGRSRHDMLKTEKGATEAAPFLSFTIV